MLRLSRRLSDRFHVIRYDRRGYGRSAAGGPPFTVADNVDDLERLVRRTHRRAGRRARLRAQLRRQHRARPRGASARPRAAGRGVRDARCRGWPGGPARRRAAPPSPRRQAIRPTPAKRSCVVSSATRSGNDCRRRREPPDAPRARPCSVNSATSAERRRGTAPVIRQPVLAMAGERARPHHRQAIESLPSMIPDRAARRHRRRRALRTEHARRRRQRRDRQLPGGSVAVRRLIR